LKPGLALKPTNLHCSTQCCGSGMFYPGSLTFSSRIRIPDPGVKKHRIPDSTVHKKRHEK
jgi:hypothetical protein